jgi:hypothetical protein
MASVTGPIYVQPWNLLKALVVTWNVIKCG